MKVAGEIIQRLVRSRPIHAIRQTEKPRPRKLEDFRHDRKLRPGKIGAEIDPDRLKLYKVIDMAG